jgi:acyl-CoA synthetase (NDP forming)
MVATASAEDFRGTIQTLIDCDACDAILAIFVPPLVTRAGDVARAISEVTQARPAVPVAAVFMTSEGPPEELRTGEVRVPTYEFPEDAARAIALAAKHGRWRARPERDPARPPDGRPLKAAATISAALARGAEWLSQQEVASLLACYGLPLIPTRVVPDASAAVAAAADLGSPVALKASAPGLLHKTDAGGIRLGLQSADEIREAAAEIETSVSGAGYELDGLVVQAMAPEGVELSVGVAEDPSFGPVLACGAGGTLAELIKDVSVRITPVTEADVGEMLRSLRTYPLLDGYRGAERCDVKAVEDVILRVSTMVETHREIVELDCNPLIALPDGAVTVDARVRIAAAPPLAPMPSVAA